MTTRHPPQLQLEMWHSGERSAAVARHLDGCSACQHVLDQLEEQRRAFLRQADSERFVRELRLKLDAESPRPRAFHRFGLAAGAVAALGGVLAALAVPLPRSPAGGGHGESIAPERLRHAQPVAASEHEALDLIPKGSGSVAAGSLGLIVRRGDEQTLVRGNVTIVPGDELRLRFSLPNKAKVGAAILTDAGAWVPFFDGEFEPGTHTPKATLRVDAEPSSGRLFFGSLEQLASARSRQGAVNGVQVIALHWRERP